MKLCVADVHLNVIVNQYDDALINEESFFDCADYLDIRFWRSKEDSKENIVHIYPLAMLPSVGGRIIWESDTCTVKQSGDAEIRIYHDGIVKKPYAVYSNSEKNGIMVWCEEDWLRRYYHTNYLFNVCALEKLLIENHKVVFHSCYIRIHGKALLFSGYSGIGKSTQGALWEKYQGASVINGDRSVLGKQDGKWYAYGFPFSGTSGICHNVTSPLAGIVFLKQAKENSIRRVDTVEAGQLLWPQITMNQWDAKFVDEALEQINQIAVEVPIYELCCTPDERAVICAREIPEL